MKRIVTAFLENMKGKKSRRCGKLSLETAMKKMIWKISRQDHVRASRWGVYQETEEERKVGQVWITECLLGGALGMGKPEGVMQEGMASVGGQGGNTKKEM